MIGAWMNHMLPDEKATNATIQYTGLTGNVGGKSACVIHSCHRLRRDYYRAYV